MDPVDGLEDMLFKVQETHIVHLYFLIYWFIIQSKLCKILIPLLMNYITIDTRTKHINLVFEIVSYLIQCCRQSVW